MRALLFCAALALAGCDTATDETFAGSGVWVLTSGADAVGAEVVFGTDRQFSARPVCNHAFGAYSASNGRIGFDVEGTTYAHCGEGQAAETAFLDALEAVERYSTSDGRLTLEGEGIRLAFRRKSK